MEAEMLFVPPQKLPIQTIEELGIVKSKFKILDTNLVDTLTKNGYSTICVSKSLLEKFLESSNLTDGVIAYQSKPTPKIAQQEGEPTEIFAARIAEMNRKLFDAFVVLKKGEDPQHYTASFNESYLGKADPGSCWAKDTYFLVTKTNLRV